MFYTIKGSNGKLIVIDGGWDYDAKRVRDTIKKLGGKVNLWMITHPHPDHVGAFNQIFANPDGIQIDQVIAPKSIDDILYEGDTLHHCVNKTDTYFDRIVSKESYILFLREKENPKVPFYTLEVEPDGTIRQKRAEFNRQNKDIDKVTSFLTLWQKEIQKRLTQKDRKSTEESRKLRQQNYQEIRDKHVVVHGGTFAGELLADLLEKDLMDLPMESAENEESPTEIAA